MKQLSVLTLVVALLCGVFGSAALGQITVTGDSSVFDRAGKPKPGTYTSPDGPGGPRWVLVVKPSAGRNFQVVGSAELQGTVFDGRGTLYGRPRQLRGSVSDRGGEMARNNRSWATMFCAVCAASAETTSLPRT